MITKTILFALSNGPISTKQLSIIQEIARGFVEYKYPRLKTSHEFVLGGGVAFNTLTKIADCHAGGVIVFNNWLAKMELKCFEGESGKF